MQSYQEKIQAVMEQVNRAVFFLLLTVTLYLASMYRSMPLLLVFLAEAILTVCMRLLSCYLKRHITAVFPEQNIVTEQFYRLLCAITLGLLKRQYRVKVCWYDGHTDDLAKMQVADEAQYRDMIWRLYQADIWELLNEEAKGLFREYKYAHENYFKLDTGLRWHINESLIYLFSADELEREIAEKKNEDKQVVRSRNFCS